MTATLLNFPAPNENRRLIEKRIRAVLDAHGSDFTGFALVVWGPTGRSTADLGVDSASSKTIIPEILVPDFVRNRLLAVKIEDWTVDTIRGYQAPSDDPA
jgi:hypothetical protein